MAMVTYTQTCDFCQHSFLQPNVFEAEHKGRGEERFLHTPRGQSLALTPLITADTGEQNRLAQLQVYKFPLRKKRR